MKKLIDAMATAYQEMAEKKMDPVGQADADIDNDGDVDKTDKYLHNRRKAIGKAMKKGKDDPKGEKGETATMNPKMDGGKSEQKESVKSADRKPEEYVDAKGKKRTRMVPVDREVVKKESTDMSIREKLMAVLEKKSHGNLDNKQPHDDLDSPGAKKMRDDNKDTGEYKDLEKKSHDDASAAGRATKTSPANPTDKDAKGDKNIVNPVKDTTKVGKGSPEVKESVSSQVKSISASYQSMYKKEEETEVKDD